MVAIRITEEGVEVDPLADVDIHPAALLFPLIEGAEFDALTQDITNHGLREPIVFTPDGQLLDGRNRWRACVKAGIEPRRRVETAEPWAYVLSTNVHRRHLNEAQRAMIGAQIAQRPRGGNRRTPDWKTKGSYEPLVLPPTRSDAAEILNVSVTAIGHAKTVLNEATDELREATEAGAVPVYTAARVARSLPSDQQDEFARRVKNGANPPKLATEVGAPPTSQPGGPAAARRDNTSPSRHRHVTVPALESLRHSLNGLEHLLRNTDGLDPNITDVEAAQWLRDLAKGRRAIAGVFNLLKERQGVPE